MEKIPTRLLTSLIAGLMTVNVSVMADTSRPKLVVGIVVDQLRTDYLEYLKSMFGKTGFRRLMDNGVYFSDVDFKAETSDPASSTALIYTGNYPPASGIASANIFSPSDHLVRPALEDKSVIGISTREALSPASLLLSTISDEVAIDGDGFTSVYAISADAQQAIIMAGHSGSGAFWINDTDGKWSSTAYYKEYPEFLTRRNRLQSLADRMDTMQWRPARKIEEYPGIPAQKRYYPFRYTFPRADKESLSRFKGSALSNIEVTDVALDAIRSLSLGKRGDAIDMLSIGYTAAPYKYVKDGDSRVELEDTYLRLDGQIGRLLENIDKEIGLGNTLIFLTSTGYYDDGVQVDPKFRLPSGDVSLKRIESLLNSYLSAKYGNGDYVAGISGNQVYLDGRKMESAGANSSTLLNDARDFLLKMSGISRVRTLADILSDNTPAGIRRANSIDTKTAGDLFIEFTPGWNVVDDLHFPVKKTPVRQGIINSPLIIMGENITPRKIDTPVDATAIAPTITSTLHIRSPNGSGTRPLTIR